jgi:hypothetical protein
MERLEIKSRVDAKLDEWKRHLDVMRIKVDASEGDAKATYHEQVAELAKEHEELRLRAAQAWAEAAERDAKWDAVVEGIEKSLDEWEKGAARTRDDILK